MKQTNDYRNVLHSCSLLFIIMLLYTCIHVCHTHSASTNLLKCVRWELSSDSVNLKSFDIYEDQVGYTRCPFNLPLSQCKTLPAYQGVPGFLCAASVCIIVFCILWLNTKLTSVWGPQKVTSLSPVFYVKSNKTALHILMTFCWNTHVYIQFCTVETRV